MLLEALRERLRGYDGRALTLLGEAEAAFGQEADFVDALIVLLADREGHIAEGASWLIKAMLERGGRLEAAQMAGLCEKLPDVAGWATQLHLCQSLQYCDVPRDQAGRIAAWLTPLLQHNRPFLRAWALDALARVAESDHEHMAKVKEALSSALEDDAASVRARARQVAKRLGAG